MPRGFAAATIWPPSRFTAETRPSDHGGATVTSWPRLRSSPITDSPKRGSTSSDLRSHPRGYQLADPVRAEARFDEQRPRFDPARVEARDQMVRVPLRRVDRRLEVEPAID